MNDLGVNMLPDGDCGEGGRGLIVQVLILRSCLTSHSFDFRLEKIYLNIVPHVYLEFTSSTQLFTLTPKATAASRPN